MRRTARSVPAEGIGSAHVTARTADGGLPLRRGRDGERVTSGPWGRASESGMAYQADARWSGVDCVFVDTITAGAGQSRFFLMIFLLIFGWCSGLCFRAKRIKRSTTVMSRSVRAS